MSKSESQDIRYRRVVRPYAEALLNVGRRDGTTDQLLEELDGVCRLAEEHPSLAAFMESMSISRDQKQASLKRIFEGRLSDALLGLLMTLCEHERLFLLESLLDQARRLHEQEQGKRRVRVTSAVPLSEPQRQRVAERAGEALAAEPLIDYDVDPGILGGLVIRIGDTLADGSVRTRLRRLRNQIMVRSRHEIQSGRDRHRHSAGN